MRELDSDTLQKFRHVNIEYPYYELQYNVPHQSTNNLIKNNKVH